MKLNINVLIGCALCVVLIGVFGVLNRTADSRDDWRPSEAYSRVGGSAYSAVSYSAASSSADGLSVPAVSMRGGNSMFRRRPVSSYAPAYSAPTSLIASSPYHLGASASNSAASALYTTSSATMKSFGGGIAASGVSISGGSVRATHSQSSIANSQLSIANIQSPIAYTQLPTTEVQSSLASNYQGIGNTTAGGPLGMRGRFNAPPSVGEGEDSDGGFYSSWLDWMVKHGWKYGTLEGDGQHYYYDKEQAEAAYNAYVAGLSEGMPIPTFLEWLQWFSTENTHTSGDYQFSYLFPMGDAWPLLVLAIMYISLITFRKSFKKNMHMIRKNCFALTLLLCANCMVAQSGLSCRDAIPVDSNYVGRIDGPCELWYTAYSYDLPLTVYFTPDIDNSEYGPDVEVDFTCTPGVYDDPKLANVLETVTDLGFDLPVSFMCDRVFRNNKYAYDLKIGKFYRDQLVECGITYNIQAFVKVRFYEAGEISLRPDTLFKNCVANSHYIRLGEKIEIQPNDSDRVFVMPYPDWVKDSTRIMWDGDEPAQIWLAKYSCDFDATTEHPFVYANYQVTKDVPYKLYKEQMENDIENSADGGIFYAKIISLSAGSLLVEKIPMNDALGGATILSYDQPIRVNANDSVSLFAIPKTWKNPTQFIFEGSRKVKMQLSNNYLFEKSSSSVIIKEYMASEFAEGLAVSFTSAEMKALISEVLDNYLYVRLVSSDSFTLTPIEWSVSECVDKTSSIYPNEQISVAKGGNTVYRINFADIDGRDLTIKWDGRSQMQSYIGDTCYFAMTSTNKHLVNYKKFTKKGEYLIDATIVRSWKDRVDSDGYLYGRFNPTSAGKLILVTSQMVLLDTIYTTVNDTLCFGDTYEWNGTTYAESGTFEKTFTASNGADSIVTLNLTVLPEVPVSVEKATINYNETYTWQGKEYTVTTTDTLTLKNKYGCDSVVVLQLTVLPKTLGACAQSALPINRGDLLTLNLDSAFTVYSIKYNDYVQAGASLTWTGAEPLHMFIAETCTFAVAPYNKYVHVYAPVPAQGEYTITPAAMADLAEFVDEDGFLYIRFLTEKEGVLTVE